MGQQGCVPFGSSGVRSVSLPFSVSRDCPHSVAHGRVSFHWHISSSESDSPVSLLQRPLRLRWTHLTVQDNLPSHSITSEKSLLPCKVAHPQALHIRMCISLEGHISRPHLAPLLAEKGPSCSIECHSRIRDLIHQGCPKHVYTF